MHLPTDFCVHVQYMCGVCVAVAVYAFVEPEFICRSIQRLILNRIFIEFSLLFGF